MAISLRNKYLHRPPHQTARTEERAICHHCYHDNLIIRLVRARHEHDSQHVCTYSSCSYFNIHQSSGSNMSFVRQHPIYFVPVLLFIFALGPATESMVAFLLKLSDRIPKIHRQLRFILCLVGKKKIEVEGN